MLLLVYNAYDSPYQNPVIPIISRLAKSPDPPQARLVQEWRTLVGNSFATFGLLGQQVFRGIFARGSMSGPFVLQAFCTPLDVIIMPEKRACRPASDGRALQNGVLRCCELKFRYTCHEVLVAVRGYAVVRTLRFLGTWIATSRVGLSWQPLSPKPYKP